MKVLVRPFLAVWLAQSPVFGQSVGVGFSDNSAILVDFTWEKSGIVYQFGLASQRSNAVGKKVDERLPNYGLTKIGTENAYASIDFGMGFRPIRRTKLVFIGTLGQREYFSNYADARFNGNGYHMVDKSETVVGVGVAVHLSIDQHWGIELGYNSLHGALAAFHYCF